MFNHHDHFDPTASEPELPFPADPSEEEVEDRYLGALLTMHRELSVAKQHGLVMDFLSRVGRLPNTAPTNAAMVLITDPEATFVAGAAAWQAFGRAPETGTCPQTVLVPLGPVDFVWDVRHTVPLSPDSDSLKHIDPLLMHHLTVSAYPVNLARCTDLLFRFADRLAEQVPEFSEGTGILGSSEEVRTRRRRLVNKLRTHRSADTRERFRGILRTAASFLLLHVGPTDNSPHPTSDRLFIAPDAKTFEVAAVEWIIIQLLTDDSTPPPDLLEYADGSVAIPSQAHLQRITTTAGKIRRELLPAIPEQWDPRNRQGR